MTGARTAGPRQTSRSSDRCRRAPADPDWCEAEAADRRDAAHNASVARPRTRSCNSWNASSAGRRRFGTGRRCRRQCRPPRRRWRRFSRRRRPSPKRRSAPFRPAGLRVAHAASRSSDRRRLEQDRRALSRRHDVEGIQPGFSSDRASFSTSRHRSPGGREAVDGADAAAEGDLLRSRFRRGSRTASTARRSPSISAGRRIEVTFVDGEAAARLDARATGPTAPGFFVTSGRQREATICGCSCCPAASGTSGICEGVTCDVLTSVASCTWHVDHVTATRSVRHRVEQHVDPDGIAVG